VETVETQVSGQIYNMHMYVNSAIIECTMWLQNLEIYLLNNS